MFSEELSKISWDDTTSRIGAMTARDVEAALSKEVLSVDDFIKKTQFTYYTKDALAKVADQIAVFARAEGLEAHARAALIRME